MKRYYTVQTPMAHNHWQQCGNSRYMNADEAMLVYRECAEHIPVAVFEIDPATGEFENTEVRRNF